LNADEVTLVRAPGLAVLHKDPEELEAALRGLSVIEPGTEIERERLWELFNVMLRPIVEDATFRYTRKVVGDAFREVALPDSPYRDIQQKLHFPAMLAMWQRYTFGTAAVLGHLEAEAICRRPTSDAGGERSRPRRDRMP
jgi:hypothetical protein